MKRPSLALLCLASVFTVAPPARAQQPARIEGTITDSVHTRPLVGAMVMLTRQSPEPATHRSVFTDEKGRYRVDSLLPGDYTVLYTHPLVDSLGLVLPARELTLEAGEHRRLDFALPSSRSIIAAACVGLPYPEGTGALLGEVTNADANDASITDGIVILGWEEMSVDPQTLAAHSEPRVQAVEINSSGGFRFCNVPTGTWLTMQVQRGARAGSLVPAMIPEDAGVLVTHISYSPSSTRSLNADSADTSAVFLRGTAGLRGIATTMSGEPLPDVLLRVPDAGVGDRTDASGRFSLANLPAGTQTLEARRLGYRYEQLKVDLRPGVISEVTLALDRAVSLDSILIVARRSRYPEFERRAQHAGFGKYLREEDIQRMGGNTVGDIIRQMPGWAVIGGIFSTTILPPGRGITSLWRAGLGSPRGTSDGGGVCSANIVIDGMQNMDIDLVRPSDIAGMEFYRNEDGAPYPYRAGCGLVIIWTK